LDEFAAFVAYVSEIKTKSSSITDEMKAIIDLFSLMQIHSIETTTKHQVLQRGTKPNLLRVILNADA